MFVRICLCGTILSTWLKKWKRLKRFEAGKYAYFFNHLSLRMLISFMLIKKVFSFSVSVDVFSSILNELLEYGIAYCAIYSGRSFLYLNLSQTTYSHVPNCRGSTIRKYNKIVLQNKYHKREGHNKRD